MKLSIIFNTTIVLNKYHSLSLISLYFRRGSLSRDFLTSRQDLLRHWRLRHLPGPLSAGSHGGHTGAGRQQIQWQDEKTLLQQRPAVLGHFLSQWAHRVLWSQGLHPLLPPCWWWWARPGSSAWPPSSASLLCPPPAPAQLLSPGQPLNLIVFQHHQQQPTLSSGETELYLVEL